MADRVLNVLFLCTHNSARSVMAEALLNTIGRERFHAFSAGSRPSGRVHPFAIEKAKTLGYLTDDIRSKSWDEFARPGAPHMDIIITVCDNAAGEACPLWPLPDGNAPLKTHWGFPDPSAVDGDEHEKRRAFDQVFHAIRQRIELLVNLQALAGILERFSPASRASARLSLWGTSIVPATKYVEFSTATLSPTPCMSENGAVVAGGEA